MNVTNDKIQDKILKYHDMLRNDDDVSVIRSEIYAYVRQYVNEVNDKINDVKQSFEQSKNVLEQSTIDKVSIRKEYNRLIDTYRRAMDIARDVSKFKKYIRSIK